MLLSNIKTRLSDYYQYIRGFLFLCLLVVPAVFLVRGIFIHLPAQYPVLELDEGWTVSRNGVVLDSHTLTKIRTENTLRGDTYVLTRRIQENAGLPSACIFFRNLHTQAKLSLDGRLFYSSGVAEYETNRMVGRRSCFAPLPADFEGRTLTIELTSVENHTLFGLGPFLFGTEHDLLVRFLRERQFPFFIAVFLCIFGTLQLFWLPFLLWTDRSNIALLYTALTTLALGIYLMGYYQLFELFTDIPSANTMLEYTSFYLISCTMSGYISTITEGRLKKMYRAFVVFDICFVALALTLHLLNVVHYTGFLLVCYTISFVEAAPFMFLILSGWHKHRKTYFDKLEEIADRSLSAGFFFYVLCVGIDAVIFSVVKFSGGQEATVGIPFITFASLVFSLTCSIHYFFHGIVNLRAEATRQTLMDKAYNDALTGLSNRGECEMLLDRLSREHKRFIIISLDLDNLKTVNDTRGHVEGDRMIAGFADILKESFAGAKLIGRMGGDEFIVILADDDCDSADQRIARMNEILESRNLTEAVFQYSASYGMAKNSDSSFGRRAHDVYMFADARMYDMKRRRK